MLCISNNIISVTDGCKCPENRSGTDGWLSPSVKSQPHRRFRCWGGTAVTVWLRSVLIPTQNTTELIWHRKRKPCQYYVFFWESADGKDSLSMCRNQTRGEWVYGAGRRATTGRRVRTQCMTVRKRVGGVCDLSLFLTAVRQQCRFKQHTVHANHMWGTLNTSTANRRLLSTRCIQFFGSWHNFEKKQKQKTFEYLDDLCDDTYHDMLKEIYRAYFAFPPSSVWCIASALKCQKPFQMGAALSHRKHCSWNASSVVPPFNSETLWHQKPLLDRQGGTFAAM